MRKPRGNSRIVLKEEWPVLTTKDTGNSNETLREVMSPSRLGPVLCETTAQMTQEWKILHFDKRRRTARLQHIR